MTIGPREVVRSEVEGLTGPAHPIPEQSIDCGCEQARCPKLARFATRRVFVSLLCWLGLLQAASHAYLYVTSSIIARRFHIDPYWMEWLLAVSEITPFFLGLATAYLGDKIHRATWISGLAFTQCVGYFLIMMPQLNANLRVIEGTENTTHMSLHAEESQELCSSGLSRLVFEDEDLRYVMLFILIFAQILAGVSNVAFYALGFSYIDDNTKKVHVAAFFGVIVASKIIGSLFGYILAWGCLRIDAENLTSVQTYQEQIGAWWLGWPILSVLLAMPAMFLSWFPRKLPSEVVEQAAASILDGASGMDRDSHTSFIKVGSTRFFPSILRLITNKILVCNVFATVFCAMAIINFIASENLFLESRFYVPRPTGMLLGFSDPLTSRAISTLLKPLVVGMVVIISGLVIARAKPKARKLIIYSIAITIATGIIIFSLAFLTCDKEPIVGEKRNGQFSLLRHCNYNCQCSRDADFRPVCDRGGKQTFYSPCHAGCTHVGYINDEKIYSGCSCISTIGFSDDKAVDGPCGFEDCQFAWLLFEIFTLLAYALLASTIVIDLLINLRSVYVQDKALSIGFWMTLVAISIHVPGKMIYQNIANMTCNYWGADSRICHLHHSRNLGSYLCYLTALLLLISVLIKCLVWWFSSNLNLYDWPAVEEETGRELQEITEVQREPLLIEEIAPADSNPEDNGTDSQLEPQVVIESVPIVVEQVQVLPTRIEQDHQKNNGPLKYGPLGPGDRRTTSDLPQSQDDPHPKIKPDSYETDNELDSSSEDGSILKKESPKVAYRPLDLDSDIEHDPEESIPEKEKRLKIKNLDSSPVVGLVPTGGRKFPNPDHYEDPRLVKSRAPTPLVQPWKKTGDFNEVGIPIVESFEHPMSDSRGSMRLLEERMLSPQYKGKASQERLETVRTLLRSIEEAKYRSEQDMDSDMSPTLRPPSRGQASSGFGSLPDVREKTASPPQEPTFNSKENLSSKTSVAHKSQPFICTDL